MHRLVYVSRSLILEDYAEHDAWVKQSAAHNETVGITGMLWSEGRDFAQVLEGEQVASAETMIRIVDVPRHTDVNVAYDRSI